MYTMCVYIACAQFRDVLQQEDDADFMDWEKVRRRVLCMVPANEELFQYIRKQQL